ncbi:MAG: ANTAR domain-containing response regulator [Myxococcota bacterium]
MDDARRSELLRVLLIERRARSVPDLRRSLQAAGCRVIAADGGIDPGALAPDLIVFDLERPDPGVLGELARLCDRQARPVIVFADESDVASTRVAVQAGVSAYVVARRERVGAVLDVAIARFETRQSLLRRLDDG